MMQLAVVDWDDAIKYIDDDASSDLKDALKNPTIADSGSIVFIASTHHISADDELSHYFNYGNPIVNHRSRLHLIDVATIWNISQKCWQTILLSALHPIITEEDAIDMELKFAIDVHRFMK